MRVTFEAVEKGAIVYEMTIRMPLAEWVKLQEQLKEIVDASPFTRAGELMGQIDDMCLKANRHWFDHGEEGQG